jgi:hypothetical protein
MTTRVLRQKIGIWEDDLILMFNITLYGGKSGRIVTCLERKDSNNGGR